jgi:hypothetical protein
MYKNFTIICPTLLLYISILLGARTLFVSTDSPDLLGELEEASALHSSWLRVVYEKDEIRGTDITNANLQNRHRHSQKYSPQCLSVVYV